MGEKQCRYGHSEHSGGCDDCPYVHGAYSIGQDDRDLVAALARLRKEDGREAAEKLIAQHRRDEIDLLRKALIAARQWMNDKPPIGTPGTIAAMRAIDAALAGQHA